MARRPNPPTVRLRRLAAELRKFRKAAKLTREEVSQKTLINAVTLYRIETARARPQRRTLLALLDLYEVGDPKRSGLVEISLGAEYPGWLRPYQSELRELYTAFISFESEARSVRNYESLLIPGLLQTEDYARAVVNGGLPWGKPEEIEHRVRARMERQAVLAKEKPLRLWAVVDEAAIRRLVGDEGVMRAQLRHLVEVGAKPHVTIQVIPFDKGAHPGMPGSFMHLEFPDPADSDLVYIDSMAGDLFLEEDADIQRFGLAYDHLRALALSPRDSAKLLASAADRY
ncbi:MAG: helix-turn-helix domain-containing protein [Micromonosporaceae bacterium]|nr:helix-turn-helix domain-containing protein [Micromonosporaceae bacterium]